MQKAPACWLIKINKPGLQTLWILTLQNYAIFFSPHGTPWHIWSRMQRIWGSNHLYSPIKAFGIYVCLQKIPGTKSPETVDAPELSQAHLYRLVIMVRKRDTEVWATPETTLKILHFYGIDARVYYEKAIHLCIAQGRICLFVIRDSEIVQILLKSVLCS